MTRILLCAGEASGDLLAAELLAELERRRPVLAVAGLCGPRMRAAGVREVAAAEDVTAVGLVEAIRAAPKIYATRRALDAELTRFRPDLVVTIDAPGLLLPFARTAKRRGFKVVHWVSPQVWAWRPGRVHTVAAAADAVLCLFPFEPARYAGTGIEAIYVGHPAADRVGQRARGERPAPVVGLAPGSRASEIDALWPVFQQVAERLRAKLPGVKFTIPVASTIDPNRLDLGDDAIRVPDIATAAARADVFLTCSGTATLELAAARVPQVIVYRVHWLTWLVGRVLVRGVRHLGLPNVLAGREIVPEYLQDLDPDVLADALVAQLGEAGRAQLAALEPVLSPLGGGAIGRTADAIERFLPPRRIPAKSSTQADPGTR